LGLIPTFVDNDLAPAVAVLNFPGPLVQSRPVQAYERRIVEVAFNDVAE
jgi:hypothetical protein